MSLPTEIVPSPPLTPLTSADFDMRYDADHTFPFLESEDAVIMAYGHPDKAEFVQLVKQYDDLCNGSPVEAHATGDVQHVWATVERDVDAPEDWRTNWGGVTAETPGAFPMTVIFR